MYNQIDDTESIEPEEILEEKKSIRILSFDVGIVNLAYCLLEYLENGHCNIIKWGVIDILDDNPEITSKKCPAKKKMEIFVVRR